MTEVISGFIILLFYYFFFLKNVEGCRGRWGGSPQPRPMGWPGVGSVFCLVFSCFLLGVFVRAKQASKKFKGDGKMPTSKLHLVCIYFLEI
jgi:hypothetical protein